MLRFIHTNLVASQARQRLRRFPPGENVVTNSAIQIFADDIPKDVARRDNKKLGRIARQLKQALRMISPHLVLADCLPFCNYFRWRNSRRYSSAKTKEYRLFYEEEKKKRKKRNTLRAVDRFELEEFQPEAHRELQVVGRGS